MPENNRSSGVWDSKECALVLIDYQPPPSEMAKAADAKGAEARAAQATPAGAAR